MLVLEENSQKTILVTGGAGFIGSHLCNVLIKTGHKIICLDNLFTGSINNISNLIENPNFEFVNHDIVEPFYRENIDEIYNLACPASPIHYQFNPIKTIKTCTIGVINMLGLAKKIMLKYYKQVQVKFMVIRKFIRSQRIIMEMLTHLVLDHVMTREKDVQRLYLWIIKENTI